MKQTIRLTIFPLVFLAVLIMLSNSCSKDDTSSSSKTDPVITWANPADISYGTLLSSVQLNATSNVSGSFIYTPAAGTKLSEGANQVLQVVFTPTDATNYNSITKTVKINVTHVATIGAIIFNPNLSYGTVTDIDGNVYKTITIDTKTWMAQNLRTTRFRNGDSIPQVKDNTEWSNLTTGAYCNYNNTVNSDIIAVYGRLYNGYVISDSRNIAPAGWHVARDDEWTALTDHAGGEDVAGGKLKETGTTHWLDPNYGSTNESGFTALPAGYRTFYGESEDAGFSGSWWSSTVFNTSDVWMQGMFYSSGITYRDHYAKVNGFSVRCVKD
jgi:uncharacterized protein (TIGR02145 family)